MMRACDASELLLDPHFLLYKVDLAGGRLIFLPTTHRLIEQASFLDGRTPIAAGPPVACSLGDALASVGDVEAGPDRFIFHVSFCGSTRLSRLIDRPGKVLALREPNVLVGLADWKAALDRQSAEDPRLVPLVRLACASLRARWQANEAVVVKPSNWVNNLLPELCRSASQMRPLFVVSSRRSFLRAVFRGGRDRLAFTAHAAAHLASAHSSHQALLNAAVRAASEPLGQAAHIAAFLHWLQLRQFRCAMAAGGWRSDRVVTFDRIEQAPGAAAADASAALGLDLSPEELVAAVTRNSGRNAKQPDAAYSPEERFEADRKIDRLQGARIEAALAWARDLLPDDQDFAMVGEAVPERRAG
jgi:hypothetical protein